jgi:nitrate reductase NapA
MRLLAGVGGASVLGAGAWAVLEMGIAPGGGLDWHKSVCRFCGTGCGVMVGMKDGRIVDIRGDELAHNRGMTCVKGSMLRVLNSLPGRLTHPRIRHEDGKLVDATWDEAMGLVARKFQEAISQGGPNAVAFYGSGQLFIEESYTANKFFKAGIRTNNVDSNARLCMASAAFGYTQTFGKDEPPGAYEDMDHADCFFIIGANPFECHPPLFERIQRRRRLHPGTFVICVDPRRTQTAERSDLHLAPVPGTDLLLLNAMAQVILAEGLADEKFIGAHVRFSDGKSTIDRAAYEKFLSDYTPEKVQDRLGVEAAAIRNATYRFARSKATMSLWTMGLNQRTQGTFVNNMVSGLHLLTGQFGRPGATPFSLTGQCNACGGVRDTGSLAHLLPNGRLVANPKHRQEVEELWGVAPGTISPDVGLDAVNLFRGMEEGKVQAALVMCTNPAQSLPNTVQYKRAMKKCFLAVAEIFEDSETAQLADVLLPAALWVEKEGVLGQAERRYQLVTRLLDPPGEARSDLQILVDLADRLGHGKLIQARTAAQVWDEYRKFSASSFYNFAGMTRERLEKERGLQWPCPDEHSPGTVRRYVEGEDPFVPKGAGIAFYGQPDHRAVVFQRPYVPSPAQVSTEFPLLLTTGRVLEQWHTGTMTGRIEELARGSGPARFEIHPSDAWPLRISSGDRVEVRSSYGTVTGQAAVTEVSRPGVLFASFYDTKLLVNDVVADNLDPTSKQPEYKVTAVTVRKLGEA